MTSLCLRGQSSDECVKSLGKCLTIALAMACSFASLSYYSRVGEGVSVRFEWRRDGSLLDGVEGTNQLQLLISEVELVHQGEYTCRVILTPQSPGAAITMLGPMSAGVLTVLGMYVCMYVCHYL